MCASWSDQNFTELELHREANIEYFGEDFRTTEPPDPYDWEKDTKAMDLAMAEGGADYTSALLEDIEGEATDED